MTMANLVSQPPIPGSMWLVVVECRYDVIRVCVSGKGFYIPGQEPCWGFDHVTEWIKMIVPPATITDAIAEYKATQGSSAERLLHKIFDKIVGLKCPHCHGDVTIAFKD